MKIFLKRNFARIYVLGVIRMNYVKIKIIGILLLITLLSTFITMPIVYSISEKDGSLDISSVRYESGIFTANVSVSDLKENSKAYFAIYDRKGVLKTVVSKSVNAGDSSFSISTDELLDRQEYNIKLMLWNENMVPDGDCYEGIMTDVVLESEHNYQDNYNKTSTYIYDGECKSIDVTFSLDTRMGDNFDYIYICDAAGNRIGEKYYGTELAGKTINVPGNTVNIGLQSDKNMTSYGYKTESIVVNK